MLPTTTTSSFAAKRTLKSSSLLEKYLREHGGAWNKADRNVASGGIMESRLEYRRDHAHPGLGKAKFTDTDKEAIAFWKEQRGFIAKRFFKNCTLDIKPDTTAFKVPIRTGVSVVEVGKTANNASDLAEGIIMVHQTGGQYRRQVRGSQCLLRSDAVHRDYGLADTADGESRSQLAHSIPRT